MTDRAVVLRGDARRLPLPDGCADLIVTSPPYWSLRDYRDGGESLEGQIGSEETWQEYLANLLACTREWVRVLKPSGSIFVNIGDKYANDAKWGGATSGKHVGGLHGKTGIGRTKVRTGIPAKSLIGLPARYALGCVDDLGLIWRRDNIWHKVGGMPESVDDRCGTKHEYVHHFTVRPRYFAALDEIREPHQPQSVARSRRNRFAPDLSQAGVGTPNTCDPAESCHPLGRLPESVWPIKADPLFVPDRIAHGRCCGGRKRPGCQDGLGHHAAFPLALAAKAIRGWSPSGICLECDEGRRPAPLSVGLDMTRPQARRARQLAERAGLTEEHLTALLSVGVSDTGRGAATQNGTGRNTPEVYALAGVARAALGGYAREYLLRRPTRFTYVCACPDALAPTRPSVIVDPFGGTGTTALVADALGRIGITVDLSADYCREIATWRISDPGERARALGVPKPPPVPDGQGSLFDGEAV